MKRVIRVLASLLLLLLLGSEVAWVVMALARGLAVVAVEVVVDEDNSDDDEK
jgi:hypothetical protein